MELAVRCEATAQTTVLGAVDVEDAFARTANDVTAARFMVSWVRPAQAPYLPTSLFPIRGLTDSRYGLPASADQSWSKVYVMGDVHTYHRGFWSLVTRIGGVYHSVSQSICSYLTSIALGTRRASGT